LDGALPGLVSINFRLSGKEKIGKDVYGKSIRK